MVLVLADRVPAAALDQTLPAGGNCRWLLELQTDGTAHASSSVRSARSTSPEVGCCRVANQTCRGPSSTERRCHCSATHSAGLPGASDGSAATGQSWARIAYWHDGRGVGFHVAWSTASPMLHRTQFRCKTRLVHRLPPPVWCRPTKIVPAFDGVL